MCGNIGLAGKIWKKEEDVFKTLLELDTIRGPHSTGIASWHPSRKEATLIAKDVGTPYDLYKSKEYGNIIAGYAHKVLIGHNRWATKGKVVAENAHPFCVDHLIGAHNGTIWNQTSLENHQEFEVDSENIYHDMAINGWDKTVPKLNGAFALVWFNEKERTLHFCRNKERPLYYAFSKDNETLIWASESWMIRVATMRNQLDIGEIFDTEVQKVYEWYITTDYQDRRKDMAANMIKKDVEFYKTSTGWNWFNYDKERQEKKDKPESKKTRQEEDKTSQPLLVLSGYCGQPVEFYVDQLINHPKKPQKSYIRCYTDEDNAVEIRIPTDSPQLKELYETLMGSCNFFRGKVRAWNGYKGGAHLILAESTIEEIKNWVQVQKREERVTGYAGEQLTRESFDKRSRHGCGICSAQTKFEQAREVEWVAADVFLCPGCKDSEYAHQWIFGQ